MTTRGANGPLSHSEFESFRSFEVTNNTLVLRRYLNHWKFKDLLESKSLYFAPASKFYDELEGHYTKFDQYAWDQQLSV